MYNTHIQILKLHEIAKRKEERASVKAKKLHKKIRKKVC